MTVSASPRVPVDEAPAMAGQNIICFAKDWAEDPTSCNHVLRELAKRNRVLWLNSIATRTPSLTSGRDLAKINAKIAAFLRGPRLMQDNLWVYTPIVLPFHHNSAVASLNRLILRMTLNSLRRKLGLQRFQLWTFVPTSAEYVGTLDEDLLVYYCTDNWSGFSTVDGAKVGEMVETLARKADVVFATSWPLVEKLSRYNPDTFLASHGVDHALFSQAISDETPLPADLAAISGPILGFYGLIEDWMDQDLIAFLAERHPEWSIVLLGRSCVDTARISGYPNIHLLGRKPHTDLPAYCKGFSVALIPHRVNDLTLHMNPIKLREYFSAGLPVVSSALPEMRRYPEFCTVAETYEEFERGIIEALADDSPERRHFRSEAMRLETWDRKVAALGAHVLQIQSRRTDADARVIFPQNKV